MKSCVWRYLQRSFTSLFFPYITLVVAIINLYPRISLFFLIEAILTIYLVDREEKKIFSSSQTQLMDRNN